MRKNLYQVIVNNIPYAIIPKSFEYNEGYAEHVTEAAQLGGGITIPVHSENVESSLGKVKFKLPHTDIARAAVVLWKKAIGLNVVTGISNSGAPVVLTEASMNNNPDFKDDGIDIEFTGSQMQTPL